MSDVPPERSLTWNSRKGVGKIPVSLQWVILKWNLHLSIRVILYTSKNPSSFLDRFYKAFHLF